VTADRGEECSKRVGKEEGGEKKGQQFAKKKTTEKPVVAGGERERGGGGKKVCFLGLEKAFLGGEKRIVKKSLGRHLKRREGTSVNWKEKSILRGPFMWRVGRAPRPRNQGTSQERGKANYFLRSWTETKSTGKVMKKRETPKKKTA